MLNKIGIVSLGAVCAWTMPVLAGGEWVDFVLETQTRLNAPSNLGANDTEEKDYAWADLDHDGDTDLVVVRKQPFTSTGRRVNVLLMNEGGVLVDRTAEYATAADVGGDLGFQTETNDRDVFIIDVDGDGWEDVITATTLNMNAPKHIDHPRIYMNLGEDGGGNWLGLRYEEARIPTMGTAEPRFCSVAAGDLTGDGAPELYFGDYDNGTGAPGMTFDYNNRLLINDGNGFFTDQTTSRLTFDMYNSAFGAASVIADMNGDGRNDIVKQTSLNPPQHVAITYNNPANEGFFNLYDNVVPNKAPYFVSVGDLNNDGDLDFVVTDDNTDQFYLAVGLDGQGQMNYQEKSFTASGGFGSNSVIADLDNDGWNDVIIADVDVDIPGCNRSTFFYHNDGNPPSVTMTKDAPISGGFLTGVHDVAVFDINDDGWLDMVIGRCSGTNVWMNQPPFSLAFDYPGGLPSFLTPGEPTEITVDLTPIGGVVDPQSAAVFVSVNDGPFVEYPMSAAGDAFIATLPAVECLDAIDYYFQAELEGGIEFTDPPAAPTGAYTVMAVADVAVSLEEDVEGDTSQWTIESDASVTHGWWEPAAPNETFFNGFQAAPGEDTTPGGTMAFVTENGLPDEGNLPGAADLDGGPTRLISPVFDLGGPDAIISYSQWFHSEGGGSHIPDFLTVDISTDGGDTWMELTDLTTGGTNNQWETVSFLVSDYVTPTNEMRVRFTTSDEPNNSITEAGIDDFTVQAFNCGGETCAADIDGDNVVGVTDLVEIVLDFGCSGDCVGDINGDEVVNVQDIVDAILAWGDCP